MRQEKSLRIGVHHANAVVREPVYRTHLLAEVRDRVLLMQRPPVVADFHDRVRGGVHAQKRARDGGVRRDRDRVVGRVVVAALLMLLRRPDATPSELGEELCERVRDRREEVLPGRDRRRAETLRDERARGRDALGGGDSRRAAAAEIAAARRRRRRRVEGPERERHRGVQRGQNLRDLPGRHVLRRVLHRLYHDLRVEDALALVRAPRAGQPRDGAADGSERLGESPRLRERSREPRDRFRRDRAVAVARRRVRVRVRARARARAAAVHDRRDDLRGVFL
eukprot:29412-Pelagococcus_subviridis.AAC.5